MKYKFRKGQPKKKPFAVSLPDEVTHDLDAIRTEHNINVRAWARDLIIEHLPELKKHLSKAG